MTGTKFFAGQFCLFLGTALCFTSQGTLDLAELHSLQYSVEILDTPVEDITEDTEDKPVSPTMTMVNKDGQKYRCSLPVMPEADADDGDKDEYKDTDIAKLLRPLEDGPCLYKTKDWWTYEICYNRAVKQYHMENDKPVGAVLVLGVHSPELDTWAETNKTYQPQWYTNGSKCDLTGRPRQTELRFVCNEAATQEMVGDIFEPQSCEYTIVVHTSRLCTVPWLRPVADPTPLPIVCNPLLSHTQMDKYKLYQERKKVAEDLAEKDRQAKKAAELASQMGAKHVDLAKPGSGSSLAGLLSSMGDNVADNLVSEINTLLDKAMAGDGGLKVVDLRGKNKDNAEEVEGEEDNKDVISREKVLDNVKPEESSASDGKWDLIHHKHQPVKDPELQELITERNNIWRKIHEAKKTVKKYTSQLHDTETFLKNEKTDTFESQEIIEKLQNQKHAIENALIKAREAVADLEVDAKDFSHKIVSLQSKLARSESKHWNRKLSVLEDMMMKGSTDFTLILEEMAKDYKKYTHEPLVSINDYFKIAKKFIDQGSLNDERFEKLRKFLQFADGELLNIKYEDELSQEETESIDDEISKLSNKNVEMAAKFRDVVKDDVREKFSEILKEVSDELDLPEGDVDKDEAMAAMTETLDKLMTKLAGTGEKINNAQKQAANLKKITGDKAATDDLLNLKRDNKKSVKKELRERQAEIMPDDEVGGDEDDDELDEKLKDTMRQLEDAESEVESLEKEILHLSNSPQLKSDATKDDNSMGTDADLKNVKVSLTNLSPGGESLDDEQTTKIVKKLEGTIRDKLSKLGLDTGGRPIEVKLITTQIPEGLEEGMGGEGEDMQVQGMFFNMMTGNMQGYEDINSQRKVENNYKFTWREDMVEDIEKKIDSLGRDADRHQEGQHEPEEVVLTDNTIPFDFYEGGDQRQRPSSFSTTIEDVISSDTTNEDEILISEDEEEQSRDEL